MIIYPQLAMCVVFLLIALSCGNADPPDRVSKVSAASQAQLDAALLAAIEDGDSQAARDAIDRGASVDAVSSEGIPALILAGLENPHLLAHLIEQGASVEAYDPFSRGSAVFSLAAAGKADSVRVLLESGGDVQGRNLQGWTPLMAASALGNLETVEVLLQFGADPQLGADQGIADPLSLAKTREDAEGRRIVDTLKKAIRRRDGTP